MSVSQCAAHLGVDRPPFLFEDALARRVLGTEADDLQKGARKPFGFSQEMNGPVSCRLHVDQAEEDAMDEHQTVTVRKTYTYQLQPTPEQEQALAFVVRRCRARYHAGLQERRDAWQQCGVSITAAEQSAQ